MIFYTSFHGENAFLMALDFENAFDSVSHFFLYRVLNSFGFGPLFCKLVNIPYTNTESCVMNGYTSTGYFKVARGIRQGNPSSPYLLMLCIEILAHMIRNNQLVKGICFGNTEIKQVLYADDITLFIKDMSSVKEIEHILEGFYKISGLKVNTNKTYILLLGPQVSNHTFTFGKLIDAVKILGVYLSVHVDIMEKINYKEILSKISVT